METLDNGRVVDAPMVQVRIVAKDTNKEITKLWMPDRGKTKMDMEIYAWCQRNNISHLDIRWYVW